MGSHEEAHLELDEAIRRVGRKIRVAFELGSRDGRDALALARRLGCQVYAFECNPASKPRIQSTLAGASEADRARITVVHRAVYHTTGVCDFRPVLGHPNIGASSLYRNIRPPSDPEYYPQGRPIKVPCTRLDDFCRNHGIRAVDLIWSDLQGADLMALETLGQILPTVKIVLMEVEYIRIYNHSHMYGTVLQRMNQYSFSLHRNMPLVEDFGNAIFIRPPHTSGFDRTVATMPSDRTAEC